MQRSLPARATPIPVAVVPGPTRHLTITIDAVRPPRHTSFLGPLGAGITDVTIPGARVHPAMQLSSDGAAAFGATPQRATVVNLDQPLEIRT